MTLKEQIIADMTAAMKARAPELDTLRMLKADIMKYEVSGADKTATDEVVLDLIKRGIKQRKEASEGFKQGGNEASSQKELDEIKILEKYMPEQLGEEEVRKIAQEVIASVGEGAQFGQVMGQVMGRLKGQADGGLVNKVVKELLG